MDYIDSMGNYYKDDNLQLFDTLPTDIFNDHGENSSELLPCSRWFDGSVISGHDGLVSDCMMPSDFMSAGLTPRVQSEHSYSVSSGNSGRTDIKLEPDIDFELEAMNAINPNLALNGAEHDLCLSSLKTEDIKQEFLQVDDEYNCEMDQVDILNCEEEAEVPVSTSPTFVVTCTTQIMKRQPTIIVTNARQPVSLPRTFITKAASSNSAVKTVHQEECRPVYILTSNYQKNCEETRLPLTPPASSSSSSSSSCSDSECSQSPKRHAPGSPHAGVQQLFQQQSVNSLVSVQQKHSTSVSNVLSPSGMIILTEEEKRTMIAEGYPVPTRLPLSKQEEKNLKKVQRKIKNKMSAQESRRKKKDYVESLEKQLEASNQENNQLKKQLEHLSSDNKSLLSQLHKLQSLAHSLSPVQSSTCLAVVILFFAVGVGIWSPLLSTSVSLSSSIHSVRSDDSFLHTGLSSDYFTPNMRSSRTLKSYEDDLDTLDHSSPAVHRHSFLDWLLGLCRPSHLISADRSATSTDTSKKQFYTSTDDSNVVVIGDRPADVTVVELQSVNSSRTNLNAPLNITYTAEVVSVLV